MATTCDFCGVFTDGASECYHCFSDRFITYVTPRIGEINTRLADKEKLTRLAIQEQQRHKTRAA